MRFASNRPPAGTPARSSARRAAQGNPVLGLQGAIGNRGVQQLMRRPRRQVAPQWDLEPGDDFAAGTTDLKARYAEVATLLGADTLRDVTGTRESDISGILRSSDAKPGLNLNPNLWGESLGRCGYIDATGTWREGTLPVTLDGPLPRIGLLLAPRALRTKATAVAVLRHEMHHAETMEMVVDQLAKWRDAVKRDVRGRPRNEAEVKASFAAFLDKQRMSDVERAKAHASRAFSQADIELPAYIEGFVSVFHLLPDTPDIGVLDSDELPPALHELVGACKHFTSAGDTLRKDAVAVLTDYSKLLIEPHRGKIGDWAWFLLDLSRSFRHLDEENERIRNNLKLLREDLSDNTGLLKKMVAIGRSSPGRARAARR